MTIQSLKIRKRGWGWTAVFCLMLSAGVSFAWDLREETLEVNIDSTYVTKYISQGYDSLDDDEGAWQPSVEFYWRGFTVGIWGSWAVHSGYVNYDELNFYVGYEHAFFEENWYALESWGLYTYIDFPHSDSKPGFDEIADEQEIAWGLSLPNLLPIGPASLVPSYSAYYSFAGKDADDEDIDNGWFQVLGLSYDLPFRPLLPEQEEQFLSLEWDLTYNDGVYGSDSNWSHSTIRVSTTFEWKGFYFTPAANYQWSFEDTVNDEDEFYASFSIGYSF